MKINLHALYFSDANLEARSSFVLQWPWRVFQGVCRRESVPQLCLGRWALASRKLNIDETHLGHSD